MTSPLHRAVARTRDEADVLVRLAHASDLWPAQRRYRQVMAISKAADRLASRWRRTLGNGSISPSEADALWRRRELIESSRRRLRERLCQLSGGYYSTLDAVADGGLRIMRKIRRLRVRKASS